MDTKLIYEDETYAIRGAIFEVYKTLGDNYLKATGHKLGLQVNFGAYPKVDIRRIVV